MQPLARGPRGPNLNFIKKGPNLNFIKKKNIVLFTYPYDYASSPALGIHFIQTQLLHKQALQL